MGGEPIRVAVARGAHGGTRPLMATDERPPAADDAPSGLPDGDAPEAPPLGPPEARPEGDGEPRRGPGAMPGIPQGEEPPTAG
jgi:hypothetical protein